MGSGLCSVPTGPARWVLGREPQGHEGTEAGQHEAGKCRRHQRGLVGVAVLLKATMPAVPWDGVSCLTVVLPRNTGEGRCSS